MKGGVGRGGGRERGNKQLYMEERWRKDVCLCWGIEKMIVTSKTNKYVAYSLSKQTDLDRYLVKECYVEGEPKGILQSDLLCEL